MDKAMTPSQGMGTRSEENKLMKTSAGKKPTMSDVMGTTPNMGKAVSHLKKQMSGDCSY